MHYGISVRVAASVAFCDLTKAVTQLMAPYNEELRHDFCDITDDVAAKYETETQTRVVMPDGQCLDPWDDRFRILGTVGYSTGDSTHAPPSEFKREIPVKELYASPHDYAVDYHSYEAVEQDGEVRYGYYHNAQGYWDWYTIGGRWRNRLPHKPDAVEISPEAARDAGENRCDVCRLSDIDWDVVQRESETALRQCYNDWGMLWAGHTFDDGGPRGSLIHTGYLRVLLHDDPEIDRLRAQGWKTRFWNSGRHCDVLSPRISLDEFRRRHSSRFHPLRFYAFVDQSGWRQPEDGEAASIAAYDSNWSAWIRSGDQADWLIVVDIHS